MKLAISDILPSGRDASLFPSSKVEWKLEPIGEVIASAMIRVVEIFGFGLAAQIRLCEGSAGASYEFFAPLVSTRPHFSGKRWWFACPVEIEGDLCGRRCGVLYAPPGSSVFGCRSCHNLTYQRCRDSRKHADLSVRIGDMHIPLFA